MRPFLLEPLVKRGPAADLVREITDKGVKLTTWIIEVTAVITTQIGRWPVLSPR